MKCTFGGYKEIEDALNARLPEKALANNLEPAVINIEGMLKKAAVVDMGRFRSSITHKVSEHEAWAGTSLKYAPFVELDCRPHWPPWGPGSELARWAHRHHIPVFLVARAISKRGTKAKHMEGASKVPGGPFEYVVENLDLSDLEDGIANDIEGGWGK